MDKIIFLIYECHNKLKLKKNLQLTRILDKSFEISFVNDV